MNRVAFALGGLLASPVLVACGPLPAKNQARPIGTEASIGEGAPTSLEDTTFEQSPAGGDPAVVGCADGQREGFADVKVFPDIAGCFGRWEGSMSLRKARTPAPASTPPARAPTKAACGDDADAACKSPADVCADGWHVCARSGDPRDLSARVDAQQCSQAAGPGKFVAAISHVLEQGECSKPPTDATRYRCFAAGWGAEPVCCGADCSTGKCKDGVWPGQTQISVGTAQGCGSVTSDRNGGILCCKDTGTASEG